MKKYLKIIIALFAVLLIIGIIILISFLNKRPLRHLSYSEIENIYAVSDSDEMIELNEKEKNLLIGILKKASLSKADTAEMITASDIAEFSIALKDGGSLSISSDFPYVFIGEKIYKADEKICNSIEILYFDIMNLAASGNIPTEFDLQKSWAGYSDAMRALSDNASKGDMSARHFPIFKFTTQSDITSFIELNPELDPYSEKAGFPSISNTIAKYDDVFFDQKVLFAIYIPVTDDYYGYDISYINNDAESLKIGIRKTKDHYYKSNSGGIILFLEIDKNYIFECSKFDAMIDDDSDK